MQRHIVITGPGRSGTTLLVQLLDELGFETGRERLHLSEASGAGLESDLLDPGAAHVVKHPWLTWQLGQLLDSGRLAPGAIEWLVVPLRSLPDAAASRVRNVIAQRDLHAPGGLVGSAWPRRQRAWLAEATYGLFQAAARYEVPVIVLEYPAFARDPAYAYRRLRPLLGDRSAEAFEDAWRRTVRPELVRSDLEAPRLADLTVARLRIAAWRERQLTRIRRLVG